MEIKSPSYQAKEDGVQISRHTEIGPFEQLLPFPNCILKFLLLRDCFIWDGTQDTV